MTVLRHMRGITLVELMTSISTLAVTLSFGIPTFTNLQAAMHRGEAAAELVTAFALARSEAARHAISVTICASTDGQTCAAGDPPSWTSGWIVFTDQDEDHHIDGGTDPDIIVHIARFDHATFTLRSPSGLADGVTLHDSGYPDGVGTFRYCDDKEYQDIALNYIGRAEITGSGSGCP